MKTKPFYFSLSNEPKTVAALSAIANYHGYSVSPNGIKEGLSIIIDCVPDHKTITILRDDSLCSRQSEKVYFPSDSICQLFAYRLANPIKTNRTVEIVTLTFSDGTTKNFNLINPAFKQILDEINNA